MRLVRLEVDADEWDALTRVAHRRGVSREAVVRQALAAELSRAENGQVDRRLAALNEATALNLPTAEIDEILRDIDTGRA